MVSVKAVRTKRQPAGRLRSRGFDRWAACRADHTVDICVFSIGEKRPERIVPGEPFRELQVLLITRKGPPFEGMNAFPGGYLNLDETLIQAAHRELGEETGVSGIYLEQLRTYDAVDRDPRRRTISTAFIGLVRPSLKDRVQAGSDAYGARWFPVDELLGQTSPEKAQTAPGKRSLAFDHDQILRDAVERLRNKVDYTLLAFQLLPEEFTMSDLRQTYEAILGEDLGTFDEGKKANFQRSINRINERFGRESEATTGVRRGILIPTSRKAPKRPGSRGPAGDLYRFAGCVTTVTK